MGGGSSDLSGGSTQSSSLSAASIQADFITQNSYGLPIQPNSNSQIAIQFDATTGWLAIAGNSANNIVKQTVTSNGYYQLDIDGHLFSSDRSSASFWQSLDGATNANVFGINFDGGLGDDTLIVGSQDHIQSFGIIADDAIAIQGEVHSESVFFKAKDIINQGAIIAGNVMAEFSNSYTDVADAKIIAIDGGNILLNGGKTGDLQATGQFLATGVTGGKIDFRGKTVSLRGANLDASGENAGGTILIGGDYQGGDHTGLGTLSNAQSTFVDKYSNISANALANGIGGKAIIWSDGNTDFRGNINARGGLKSGDGGFVEVSGKENLNFVGKVDVDATNGKQGSILLDPENIIINPDDDDDSTFDVSNLQELEGDVTLSATNSIVFNTNAYFVNSQGTITLQSSTVNLFGAFSTGGRNLNISGAAINGTGYISSSSYAGKSGYIKLVSQREINLGTSTIFSESSGKSGNIILTAGTTITTGFLTAAGAVRGGDVNLSAKGDILTSTIRSFSDVNGGAISVVSTEGNIDTTNDSEYGNGGYISSYGISRVGGSVTMSAFGNILTKDIHADGEVRGGNVKLSAKGDILTSYISTSSHGIGGNVSLVTTGGKINTINDDGGYISTYGANGNGGSVTLTADGDITTSYIHAESYSAGGKGGNIKLISLSGGIDTNGGSIFSYANDGNAGIVTLTANKDIKVGDILTNSNAGGDLVGNGGKVTLTATSGNIEAGSITTSSQNGAGGNIKVEAGGDILTGAIASNVSAGSGNGGNVAIATVGNVESGNITTASNTGNAGYIKIAAGSLTELDKDIKVGDVVASSNADGNAAKTGGLVLLKASGNIESGKIFTSSVTGNAGNIGLNADLGITVGNIDASANGDGNAGSVTLVATEDIDALAIKANVSGTGVGTGGKVKLVSKEGNILTDYVRTDSAGAVGGNITLDAGSQISNGIGGAIRAISSFSIDGEDLSFFTGIREGAAINIKYRPMSFTVGDSSENGTKGMIMSSASLVTDLKIENSFKLASLNNKTEIIVQSSTTDERSALAKKVDNLINKSYQYEFLQTIVLTTFQNVYATISAFLFGTSSGSNSFLNYIDQVRTLEKAKALTEAAALKDSKYSGREELAAQSVLPIINLLLTTAKTYSVTDKAQIAYILATVSHESQFGIVGLGIGNSNPMYEYGNLNYFNNKYVNKNGNGGLESGDAFRYRGRGYVQLTGKSNYEKFQNLLNVDITATTNGQQINGVTQYIDEADPDKVAMDRVLAAKITVLGMRDDLYVSNYPNPAFGLSKWLRDTDLNPDFINARKIVNDLDEADKIKDQAIIYLKTLREI